MPAGNQTWRAAAAPMKRPWATAEAALVEMQGQLLQQQAAWGLEEAMESHKRVSTTCKAKHILFWAKGTIIGHIALNACAKHASAGRQRPRRGKVLRQETEHFLRFGSPLISMEVSCLSNCQSFSGISPSAGGFAWSAWAVLLLDALSIRT